jgi:hypothetical protein
MLDVIVIGALNRQIGYYQVKANLQDLYYYDSSTLSPTILASYCNTKTLSVANSQAPENEPKVIHEHHLNQQKIHSKEEGQLMMIMVIELFLNSCNSWSMMMMNSSCSCN